VSRDIAQIASAAVAHAPVVDQAASRGDVEQQVHRAAIQALRAQLSALRFPRTPKKRSTPSCTSSSMPSEGARDGADPPLQESCALPAQACNAREDGDGYPDTLLRTVVKAMWTCSHVCSGSMSMTAGR